MVIGTINAAKGFCVKINIFIRVTGVTFHRDVSSVVPAELSNYRVSQSNDVR
jgi:hypothetical protein